MVARDGIIKFIPIVQLQKERKRATQGLLLHRYWTWDNKPSSTPHYHSGNWIRQPNLGRLTRIPVEALYVVEHSCPNMHKRQLSWDATLKAVASTCVERGVACRQDTEAQKQHNVSHWSPREKSALLNHPHSQPAGSRLASQTP